MKFFVFPADPKLQKRWTVAIYKDKWLSSKHNRLYSAHFVSGRPSNDPDSVNYMPSMYTDGKKRRPAASKSPDDLDEPASGLRFAKTTKK